MPEAHDALRTDRAQDDARQRLSDCEPLRAKLEGRLRQLDPDRTGRVLSDRDWSHLVAQEDVKPHSDADDIETAARLVLKWKAAERAVTRDRVELLERGQPISFGVDDPRYDSLARIQALAAAEAPAVVKWRREHLPEGKPLQLSEVESFVDRLWHEEGDEVVEHELLVVATYVDEALGLLGGIEILDVLKERHHFWLPFVLSDDGSLTSRNVLHTGPLGQLLQLAFHLSEEYAWQVHESTTFVMTGRVPRPRVMEMSLREGVLGVQLKISVDPRVPTTELARAYDEIRGWFGQSNESLRPEKSRPLKPRRARMASFLMEHRLQSWAAINRRWNSEHPEWQTAGFRWEALDAWRRVVGRDFIKPKRATDSVVGEPDVSYGLTRTANHPETASNGEEQA